MSENTFALPVPTWRDRLRRKLFPTSHCDCPEAPAHFQGAVVAQVAITISFLDRLRLLVSGRAHVTVKVITEHDPGPTRSQSSFYAAPPEFLDRQIIDRSDPKLKGAA